MPERWCTEMVSAGEGRRHSLDVLAASTYDAAHLYVTHARTHPGAQLPVLNLATVFEVVTESRIYREKGEALQRWIDSRRQSLQGPRAALFRRRPALA